MLAASEQTPWDLLWVSLPANYSRQDADVTAMRSESKSCYCLEDWSLFFVPESLFFWPSFFPTTFRHTVSVPLFALIPKHNIAIKHMSVQLNFPPHHLPISPVMLLLFCIIKEAYCCDAIEINKEQYHVLT